MNILKFFVKINNLRKEKKTNEEKVTSNTENIRNDTTDISISYTHYQNSCFFGNSIPNS